MGVAFSVQIARLMTVGSLTLRNIGTFSLEGKYGLLDIFFRTRRPCEVVPQQLSIFGILAIANESQHPPISAARLLWPIAASLITQIVVQNCVDPGARPGDNYRGDSISRVTIQ